MIKTVASLFAIYGLSLGQIPPVIPPVLPPQATQPQTTRAQPPAPPQPQTTAVHIGPPPIELPPIEIIPLPATTAPGQTQPIPQPQTTAIQTPPVGPPATTLNQWVPIGQPQTTLPAPPNTPAITRPAAPAPPRQTDYLGVYGQLCPVPPPDAVCLPSPPTFGGAAIEQNPGFTKCERIGDCCGCASISCGNEWTGCNTFSAGDYGAYGVEQITVYGRSEQMGGAQIHCLGISGCENAVITAAQVKTIAGDKARSLKNARVKIIEPIADFSLDCIGPGSCEGLNLTVVYPGPPAGYQCNPALMGQTIEMNSLTCYGRDSCKNMHITIDNQGCNRIEIQQIECYAATACVGANFDFKGLIDVNSCDLIGSSAGVATGLVEACGLAVGPGIIIGGNPVVPINNPGWIPLGP